MLSPPRSRRWMCVFVRRHLVLSAAGRHWSGLALRSHCHYRLQVPFMFKAQAVAQQSCVVQ